MKQRWLFIDSAWSFGGHEVMLLRFMQELAEQGRVTPALLAREGSTLAERAQGLLARQALPPLAKRSRNPLVRLRDAWRELCAILRAIRHEQPDLCVVATGHLGYPVTVLAARLSGCRCMVYVPLVDSFSTMGYRHAWLKDAVVRLLLAKLPHGWITISPQQAQSFAAWARPRGPVYCLPNAVSPGIENAPRIPPAAAALRDPLRVLVFGRLDAHQKGLDMLIRHLAAHPELDGQLVVSIIGDGPYRATLEMLRTRSRALTHIVRLGPWADTIETLRAHDVLFLPSRFEGVPLVMLEAMALGLPVIASDLPGTRPYLNEHCLFPVGDIARAFGLLGPLRDPVLRNALIARNRVVFASTSSGHAFSRAVARLVEQLHAGPPAPRPALTRISPEMTQ